MHIRAALLAFCTALLLPATQAYAQPEAQAQIQTRPVLSAAELQAELPTVAVLDIRPFADYAQGHIEGALSAPYASWRGPADNPGKLPDLTTLTALVRQLGLAQDRHAVVVSSGANETDFGAAARVYWTLKYLGLENLSVLNGGMQAWKAAGLPVTQNIGSATPSSYAPRLNTAIVATQEDVQAQLNNPAVTLVDARPANFFKGETKAPTASTPGTIQGAINIAHSVWFVPGTTQVVSPERAREITEQQFPQWTDSSSISFCNTGHWAATDWFALSELAGLPDVRMYPESLAGWTNASAPLPMDHTPGRGSQIAAKIKSLFNGS